MLSVIFPAYNEAANLRRFPEEVIPVLERLGRPYEIVIVDDGSKDDTAAVAEGLGPPVRVVRQGKNLGLGQALRTGFGAARGDLVVTMDTDLTFAPSLVEALLERFDQGDVDVVSGSPKLAGYGADIPSYRIAVSMLATLTYTTILQRKITSVSPILRLYRKRDLDELTLAATGFDINAEILFGLIRHGKRVVEIPAPLTVRIHGESNLNYRREMQRHARLVLRMLQWRFDQIRGRA
jgi:dolichol-phosphate mannosyltransferase